MYKKLWKKLKQKIDLDELGQKIKADFRLSPSKGLTQVTILNTFNMARDLRIVWARTFVKKRSQTEFQSTHNYENIVNYIDQLQFSILRILVNWIWIACNFE